MSKVIQGQGKILDHPRVLSLLALDVLILVYFKISKMVLLCTVTCKLHVTYLSFFSLFLLCLTVDRIILSLSSLSEIAKTCKRDCLKIFYHKYVTRYLTYCMYSSDVMA